MKRLLILPAVAAVCTFEVWRRGFVAPLAYGARLWLDAARMRPETEYDPI